MLDQGADVEGCGHGAKGALHLLLSRHTARIVMWYVPRARETLSKQTTIDYDGEVSQDFDGKNLVALRTLDSGMSALLLAQRPPPLFWPRQFYPASH